jgi:hypothetical protein
LVQELLGVYQQSFDIVIRSKQMFRKILSLGMVSLLVTVISTSTLAQAQSVTNQAQAEAVKLKVTKLGLGKRTRVEIQLKRHGKLKGYIGAIGENGFTVVDSKRGTVTPVPYGEVQQIKDISHSWLAPAIISAATVGGLMLLVSLSLRGT